MMNKTSQSKKPARPQTVDIIIKFGGSAITDKTCFETLRPAQLAAAVDCVRLCVENGLSCIVVHGAGSFGHHQARKFQINTGFVTTHTKEERQNKILGYSLTRQSVTKLDQLVINRLIEGGVPAIQCSPGSSWELDKRQPVKWPKELVAGFLLQGLVPVFHGDCCLDAALGCCILSGDTVIKSLCGFFDVKRVVFLTDVDGIYDKPPDQPGAKLMKTISVGHDGSLKHAISTSQSKNDVTGGIMLKLSTAVDIVVQTKGSCVVHVCSVESPAASRVCLESGQHKSGDFTTVYLENHEVNGTASPNSILNDEVLPNGINTE
ncbi:unnamed protein product [Candidula unifasciata]|uniref:Isopentenyl phosphate kinase n=1 Tax=Candidula unifasciata TaxID=100452 RepID=A0A8S4A0T5_9EUPU|nr:unnamed protein product [Candidula unifasciata]